MPITIIAIFSGAPGTNGIAINARPPSATQPAPNTPRAQRVPTPRLSMVCDSQPEAMTTNGPAAHGSVVIQLASFCVKPRPWIRNGVNQPTSSASPQYAPNPVAKPDSVVPLKISFAYGTRSMLRCWSAVLVFVIEPSRPNSAQATTQISPSTPSSPNAQCQEYSSIT